MTQIADVYHALRTNRPYRNGLGSEAAIQTLKDGRGTEFEPKLLDNFMDIIRVAEITECELEECDPEDLSPALKDAVEQTSPPDY